MVSWVKLGPKRRQKLTRIKVVSEGAEMMRNRTSIMLACLLNQNLVKSDYIMVESDLRG